MHSTDLNVKCFLLPACASCRFQRIQSGIDREPESKFSREGRLLVHNLQCWYFQSLQWRNVMKCQVSLIQLMLSSIKAPPISGLFLTHTQCEPPTKSQPMPSPWKISSLNNRRVAVHWLKSTNLLDLVPLATAQVVGVWIWDQDHEKVRCSNHLVKNLTSS